VPATSVPYWSDQCGVRFFDALDIDYAFDEFCSKIYTPYKFVEENLSYKQSVKTLMEIFDVT